MSSKCTLRYAESGLLSVLKWGKIKCSLLLMTAFLQGCSSPPPVHYSLETRYESAKFAVVENTRLQAIVDACSEVGRQSMETARKVQRDWWRRNWPYVGPADKEMSNHVKMMQHKYGEILGQLDLLFFHREIKEQVAATLKNRIVKTNNRVNACNRRLDPYRSEMNDLIYNDQHADILESIRMDYLNISVAQPYSVPSFKTTVHPIKNLGRSMRSVEKYVEKNLCTNYLVINLHNNWPKETYGVICGGKAKAVMDCNWGTCKITESY